MAVRVELSNGDNRYFLTWGRVPDPVDTQPLEQMVLSAAGRFALGYVPVSAHVCASLQEAAGEPYFFECFFKMCHRPIPYGAGYGKWASEVLQRLKEGKEMYYLGRKNVD